MFWLLWVVDDDVVVIRMKWTLTLTIYLNLMYMCFLHGRRPCCLVFQTTCQGASRTVVPHHNARRGSLGVVQCLCQNVYRTNFTYNI